MQVLGGMQGAFDIWERAIVPSLLANCGCWVGISKSSLKILDGLHNLFCRLVFSCPGSTPVPAFRGQAGLQDFEHRVMTQKVSLVQLSNAKTLKEQMIGLSKLEHLMHKDLRFSQDYVKTKSLEDARLEFRWQTGMLDNRAKMGRRYSGKTYPHCEDGHEDGAIESSLDEL